MKEGDQNLSLGDLACGDAACADIDPFDRSLNIDLNSLEIRQETS